MKCNVITNADKNEVIIYTKEKTPLTDEIERLCRENGVELVGYRDESAVLLTPSEIYSFTVEDDRLYARSSKGKFRIKMRLYRVEELIPDTFVRINQSCIANIKAIERFEVTIGGTLAVAFKDGYRDYVSRRQTKLVKERLGLK